MDLLDQPETTNSSEKIAYAIKEISKNMDIIKQYREKITELKREVRPLLDDPKKLTQLVRIYHNRDRKVSEEQQQSVFELYDKLFDE